MAEQLRKIAGNGGTIAKNCGKWRNNCEKLQEMAEQLRKIAGKLRCRNQTSRSLKEQHSSTGDTRGANTHVRGTGKRQWRMVCGKLRKIAENWGKLRNCEKWQTLPRMVTRELSRVCWLRQVQHNGQHMQSQEGEKSLSRAEHGPGRLSQKVYRNGVDSDPLREKEGNIIDICSIQTPPPPPIKL